MKKEKKTKEEPYRSYDYFGAHPQTCEGADGVVFRLWAPRARAVSLVGDFNDWEIGKTPMALLENGVWECFVSELARWSLYKFAVTGSEGKTVLKADPYGFHSETQGAAASKVCFLEEQFRWTDGAWRRFVKTQDIRRSPMNIYEVHLGTWRRYEDGSVFNYRKCADELVPYAKELGYTHLELLPLMEHPFDGSWGYQVTGYFAVTSRYGSPGDFMYFVNKAHRAGLGVILDWVPAHFPKDEHGLIEFDGRPLYEDPNPTRMEHLGWGTRIFDYGRPEVQDFLISNALFYLDRYHIDGLRVDAVAAMIYLDYDRKPHEWQPNVKGGRENLEAVAFLQKLNQTVLTQYPHALMIAEESTAWPMVTMPPEVGGLGFSYKWNMGWMNDALAYAETDPLFRKGSHDKLTFPLVYAFSEQFILPISHDEVVHGKRSLLDKMPGDYDQKFAGVRAFWMYMLTQPGKKLMFMGAELGQFKEWDDHNELDWLLLHYDKHRALQNYVRDANHFYLGHPQLWENDEGWDGFAWLNPNDKDRNVLSYRRMDRQGRTLLIVINFAPVYREGYLLGVPEPRTYEVVFNSDDLIYGGSGLGDRGICQPLAQEQDGQAQALALNLPPMSALLLQ